MDGKDRIANLGDRTVEGLDITDGGQRGLGDHAFLAHQAVKILFLEVRALQVALFAKANVERKNINLVLFFPVWRHVGGAVGNDPQHCYSLWSPLLNSSRRAIKVRWYKLLIAPSL